MRVGEFELRVRGDDSYVRPHTPQGHVPMRHGEQYSLDLINHTGDRVNLYVKIDGKSVGDFQIGPYATATLERPVDDHGRFTFFAADSGEASAVGGHDVSRQDQGLVEVIFAPERRVRAEHFIGAFQHYPSYSNSLGYGLGGGVCRSAGLAHEIKCCSTDLGAGVTGMTGHSSQEFGYAGNIVEDESRKTAITLRLVLSRGSFGSPRPLPSRRGNPVPSPV